MTTPAPDAAAGRRTAPSADLETFPNPAPGRDYTIRMRMPEFTCLCPRTGQPDFATLDLDYIPDQRCVELKSLKLYIWSFRDRGTFHEAVTNEIVDQLVGVLDPRFLRLTAHFHVRGGITTSVTVLHRQAGWDGPVGAIGTGPSGPGGYNPALD